jgi:hypothetical protein
MVDIVPFVIKHNDKLPAKVTVIVIASNAGPASPLNLATLR